MKAGLKPQLASTLRRRSQPPRGLSRTALPAETRIFIEAETLDIYTSMVNAGSSLQETLTAIFLSGMSAAHAAIQPPVSAQPAPGFITCAAG